MSFPRAPITRFNEAASVAPAPNAYTPRLPPSQSSKVVRFGEKPTGFCQLTAGPSTPITSSTDSLFSDAKNKKTLEQFTKRLVARTISEASKTPPGRAISPVTRQRRIRRSLENYKTAAERKIKILEANQQHLLDKIKRLRKENHELKQQWEELKEELLVLKESVRQAEIQRLQETQREQGQMSEVDFNQNQNASDQEANLSYIDDNRVDMLAVEIFRLEEKYLDDDDHDSSGSIQVVQFNGF